MDPLRRQAAMKAVADFEKTLKDDDAKNYTAAKKARQAMRRKVTLATNSLNEEIAKDYVEETSRIKNYLKNLQETSQKLEALQEGMDALILDEEAAAADLELHYNDYTTKVIDSCSEADAFINNITAQLTALKTPKKASVLLPKAQLPKFNGKSCAEYMSFIDTFNAMIGSKDMFDVEKLTYLKLCLQDEAKTIADGYLVKEENYNILLQHLQAKFGQNKLIQRDYFNNLYDLPSFKQTEISTWNNRLMTIIKSLESTGVDIEANKGFVVTLIQRKMPLTLLQKWDEEEAEEEDFSAERLFTFLEVKAKAMMSQEKAAKDTKPKQPTKSPNNPQTTASMLSTNATPCPIDNHPHKLEVCPTFLNKTVQQRNAFVWDNWLCKRCLAPLKGHKKPCTVKCQICHTNGRPAAHHTLIHSLPDAPHKPMRSSAPYQNGNNSTKAPDKNQTQQVTTSALTSGISVTKNVPAIAITPSGNKIKIRVFVDEGSDRTFTTDEVQARGKFKSQGKETLSIATFGDKKGSEPAPFKNVSIPLETKDGGIVNIEATIWKGSLGKDLKEIPMDPKRRWEHLKDIQFEEEFPRGEKEVDLIIGIDQAHKVLITEFKEGKNPSDPIAQNTRLGWILYGKMEWENKHSSVNFASVNKVNTSNQETEELVKAFWEVENDAIITKDPGMSKEDQDIVENFEKTIQFNEEKGTYTATIPYTSKIEELESNKAIATQAFYSQEKRMDKNPEMKKNINKVFKSLEEQQMIEKVPKEELENHQAHYLIWHAVNRPDHPTTPVRVVNNASKKGRNGVSLNDCQPTGPNFLPLIPGLVISLRKYRVAIIADISKMFLRIGIPVEQSDLHRFLFRCTTTHLVEVWRMLVVMFGEKSSPFLANATVKHHAKRKDIQEKFPKAVKVILNNELYMDDTTTGADSDEEAYQLYEELLQFFATMGMSLQKFNSNSETFLNAIDQDKRSKEAEIDLVLGIKFDTKNDELSVNVKTKFDESKPITKRVILREIASFFDPLGINSPLLVKGKIILQKCWREQTSWDEPVSLDLKNEFKLYLRASRFTLRIPRPYTQGVWSGTQKQLHCFCDASEEAYAACVYLQVEDEINLVISKARVKPLKEITLPRLELLGALIGTRLTEMVKENLQESQIRVNYWTDSTIVINWLHAQPFKMKTFIRNRIVEIQKAASPLQWKWLPGEDNPATYQAVEYGPWMSDRNNYSRRARSGCLMRTSGLISLKF